MKLCFLDEDSLGPGLDMSIFSAHGTYLNYSSTQPHQVAERIADCDIVLTNKVIITNEDLDQSNIRLIAIAATGANVVDLAYCQAHHIAVCNVAGYSTNSVAQHTLALVLALLENLSYYDDYTKSKAYLQNPWATHLRTPYYELAGKTWGIIGLGHIGMEVARIAQAFHARVIFYSTSGLNQNPMYERVSLDGLMASSDIISIHAPLHERTHHLLKEKELQLCKKSAIICNVSRGALVHEGDMANALNEDWLRGYATDVYSTEPPEEDFPLFQVHNPHKLLMTPHMAFCSTEARKQLLQNMNDNIASFLKGEMRNRLV